MRRPPIGHLDCCCTTDGRVPRCPATQPDRVRWTAARCDRGYRHQADRTASRCRTPRALGLGGCAIVVWFDQHGPSVTAVRASDRAMGAPVTTSCDSSEFVPTVATIPCGDCDRRCHHCHHVTMRGRRPRRAVLAVDATTGRARCEGCRRWCAASPDSTTCTGRTVTGPCRCRRSTVRSIGSRILGSECRACRWWVRLSS